MKKKPVQNIRLTNRKKPVKNQTLTKRSNRKRIGVRMPSDEITLKAEGVPEIIGDVGRVDRTRQTLKKYWETEPRNLSIYSSVSLKRFPKKHRKADPYFVMELFNLTGLQFGNWLSQADRKEYLIGIYFGLYDMKYILGWTYANMGLNNSLGIALGSRGVPRALAHYEPATRVINLSRYRKEFQSESRLSAPVLRSGGAGSLAHEYGHAIDFHFGHNFDKSSPENWLTDGASIRWKPDEKRINRKTLRGLMEKILAAHLTDGKGNMSKWRMNLGKVKNAPYYCQRTEIWARLFEAYIAFKMKKRGVKNTFLTKFKYDKEVYPTPNMIRAVEKDIDELMRLMKNQRGFE